MKEIICGLMCIAFSVNAQTNIEKTGPDVNTREAPRFRRIVGYDQNSFCTLRSERSTYTFEQLNKTDLKSIKQIASITFKNPLDYELSYIIKDKLYFITKQYNTGDKKCELTINEFISNAVNTESKSKILFEFDTDKSKWYQTFFQYAFSPDSSKIAIISDYLNDINYHLYDSYSFKEIASKKIPSIPGNDKTSIEGYQIDNNGNLFYNYSVANNVNIIKQSAGAEKEMTGTLKLNKLYEYGKFKLYFDVKNDQIYIYTVFYEKSKNVKSTAFVNGGFYIRRMDSKTMISTGEKHINFSSEVLTKLSCDKTEPELNTYYANISIINNSDIILEAYASSSGSFNRGGGTGSYDMSQKVYLFADEIIVAKLNSTLDLNWMKLIPRSNTYTNITGNTESTLEYSRLLTNNSLSYVYIEHPKFVENKIDFLKCNECNVPNIKSYVNTNVVKYSLDFNGQLSKKVLYFNDPDTWLIPILYNLNLGENKYLVRFRKGKNESLSIINIK